MGNVQFTSPACIKCGQNVHSTDPRPNGLCESCEAARLKEINDIYEYFTRNPEECCCHTYLGRHDCMSPTHGDKWKVNAISDGQRFHYIIRAHDRKEAMEVGREMCEDNGEECTSVKKVAPDPCIQCGKECGDERFKLTRIPGSLCSRGCCDAFKKNLPKSKCSQCNKDCLHGTWKHPLFKDRLFCSKPCFTDYFIATRNKLAV